MKHHYTKVYKNIEIRPLKESDLEYLRNWRNNPANTRYLSQIPFITEKMQSAWYEKNLLGEDEITFAIDEINILHRMVGSMSLYNFNNGRAEFGKILIGDKEAHGKRVGCHSIKALLNVAFNELNLQCIYLHVFENNIVAKKVYEQVGFYETESHDTKNGIEITMIITKKDFFNEMEK